MKPKPDFLIIGAQKSGTTSLHYYLNQHDRLIGSLPKEIHYFDAHINYGKSIEWYCSHFEQGEMKENALHFETTPSYLYYEYVAGNIQKLYPSIKLICILREPSARAYSAWNMYKNFFDTGKGHLLTGSRFPGKENMLHTCFFKNRETFPSFYECLLIEKQIIENNPSDEPALLRRGCYYNQLVNYYKCFNQDQLLVLGFKELTTRTEQTLNKILKFLNQEESDWSFLQSENINPRQYEKVLQEDEKKILEDFYSEPNTKLEQLIGKIDW